MHSDNCFVTLTYDDENLPPGGTLDVADFQKFMKRARKRIPRLRYFHCGEYGETTLRPHYHALLFGWRPDDPKLFRSSGEFPLYESPTLSNIWGLGHASFGEVTFESASYVARYITKKVTGEAAKEHYQVIDEETGEVFQRNPEYTTGSRDPAVGVSWLQKYGRDAYEKDEVVLRARAMRPPRAYDIQMALLDPALWDEVRVARERKRYARYEGPFVERVRMRREAFREYPPDPKLLRALRPSREADRNPGQKDRAREKIAHARLQSRSGI